MECNHCDDLDNTCGDCTQEIVAIAEAAEARAAEQDKTIISLCDERDELRRQLEQAQADLERRDDVIRGLSKRLSEVVA
jgi:uncharacterized coiled-coil protein SlyX